MFDRERQCILKMKFDQDFVFELVIWPKQISKWIPCKNDKSKNMCKIQIFKKCLVENVWNSLNILGLLFIVRILSIALWSFLLRVFGKIRLMDGYFHIQQKFWLIMAIHEAYSLNEVSLSKLFLGLWTCFYKKRIFLPE